MNKRMLYFICLFLMCTQLALGQLTGSQIDSIVNQTLKTFDVPGIAVGIVKDGKLIHAKGYGYSSLNTNQRVNETTLFGIASNSKAFTAAALGMLVEESKLKWDTKVNDILPEFKMYDAYVSSEFTVRDLLTHRSGLGLGAGDLMFWPDSNSFTKAEIIHNLRYLKPVSSFRTKYDYDNLLYIVAGEVVAKISGMSWEEFIQKRFFDALGITNSAPSYNLLKSKSNVIDPHAPVNGKVKVLRRDWSENANAAGGIYANVVDMSKWLICLMNRGKYGNNNEKQLLTEATINEMWTPQTIIPVRNPGVYNTHFNSYGLGWFLSDVKGYKQVTHTGGLAGIVTQTTLIPELNLGIMVYTNQQSGAAFNAITNTIKDSYLGVKGLDRIKENFERQKKMFDEADNIQKEVEAKIQSNKSTNQTLSIDKIFGTYQDIWFGDVVIDNSKNGPWFSSKKSYMLNGPVTYYNANTFIVRFTERSFDADCFLHFTLDKDGNTVEMKMEAISPLTDFSFDFQDLAFVKK
jgi:CubicO group peptidase (beta-lactamase class C family)